MKRIKKLSLILVVLVLASCSQSHYPSAQKPLPTSTRYRAYNQPVHSVGINLGAANLDSRFTGVREKDNLLFGDRAEFYLENISITSGGFYRRGLTSRFGLQLGLDYYRFSGSFGLGDQKRDEFKYEWTDESMIPGDDWVIGNVEDNFFEGFMIIDRFTPKMTNHVNRFENSVLSFSFLPYYYLPVFERRPQQMPNAKRVFLYGGIAGNYISPVLSNRDNERVSSNEGGSMIEKTLGFSMPLGLGFSWRLSRDVALEYSFDYRLYLGNHGSGLVDTRADDRQFSNRVGLSYRIR